jgi:hypothetical protein
MSFDELLEPINSDEARTILRDLVITSPAQIPAEVVDTPTTSESAIVYALGEGAASFSKDRALFARSAARSTATDPYLRVIAKEQFSLPPRTQTFGTTNIVLDNASDSFYGPYEAGQFVVRNSATKKLYSNISPIDPGIPGGTTGLVIGVRAVEAGTDSNANPGEINELETPLQGVSITNPAALIALDNESADSLNNRIDKKIGSLGVPGSRGWSTGATDSSFEAIALNGPDDEGIFRDDGSIIEVTRTQVVGDNLAGTKTLFLADDDGPLLSGDVVTVRNVVQPYAEWLGLELDVENSTQVTITYSGTLTIDAKKVSASDIAIRTEMQKQLTALGRTLKVGEAPAYDAGRDAILDAGNAGKATAFKIKEPGLVLSSPLAYAALNAGEVASLVLGTMTIVRA